MPERKGQFTVTLSSRPSILGYAAVVGKKEGEGPLGRYFDYIFEDTTLGEKTWEKAESAMQREAFTRALDKAGISPSQVNYIFAGDLLNQNIASTFGLREYNVPFLGQFGACSTMAQTLGLSAILVDSGAADICSAITSSHFCSAERQFRFPLEYGGQRPPTSQWTATASGSAVVGMGGNGVRVAAVTFGRVTDLGITDANNMGAAMAPGRRGHHREFPAGHGHLAGGLRSHRHRRSRGGGQRAVHRAAGAQGRGSREELHRLRAADL